jgi:hypothetical protein
MEAKRYALLTLPFLEHFTFAVLSSKPLILFSA